MTCESLGAGVMVVVVLGFLVFDLVLVVVYLLRKKR